MFFGDFELWKLHTFTDYAVFILYVITVAAIVYFAIVKINKGRNDAAAAKRVAKKLKPKGGNFKVYNNVNFNFGGEKVHFDHLIIDAAGIVGIRTIGRGLKIYGEPEADTWKVTDNKDDNMRITNPIKELKENFEKMRKYLNSNGAHRVMIDPLAVFADPFATPELYLGRDSSCIVYDGVKVWLKNRTLRANSKKSKGDAVNIEDIAAALEKAIVKE